MDYSLCVSYSSSSFNYFRNILDKEKNMIPCFERLPQKDGRYPVAVFNSNTNRVERSTCYFSNNRWILSNPNIRVMSWEEIEIKPKESTWIPCTDHLPAQDGWYLVTTFSKRMKTIETYL